MMIGQLDWEKIDLIRTLKHLATVLYYVRKLIVNRAKDKFMKSS